MAGLAAMGLALVGGVAMAPAALGQVTTIDGLEFTVDTDRGTATVTAYDFDYGTEVDIPDRVAVDGREHRVTQIGDEVFQYYATQVSLPDGLESIGEYAFANAELTTIDLPDSLRHIGAYAFGGNELTAVTVPPLITELSVGVFARNKLTEVNLPPDLEHIGDQAFMWNPLRGVELPDGLHRIGDQAFFLTEMSGVTLPPALEELGREAFLPHPDAPVRFTEATFTGPPPERVGDSPFPAGTVVYYPWAQDGFTWPEWHGYPTVPVADVRYHHDRDGDAEDRREVAMPRVGDDGEERYPYGIVAEDLRGYDGPPDDPVREGHEFTGWYVDPDAGTVLDPDTDPVTGDLDLFAGWDRTGVEIDLGLTDERVEVAAGASAVVNPQLVWQGAPYPEAVHWSLTGIDETLTATIDDSSGQVDISGTRAGAGYLVELSAEADARTYTATIVVDVLPGPTAAIDLTPSAMTAQVGETVLIEVQGHDAFGNSTGDVTDQTTFRSDMPQDEVSGNAITFGSASPHTITATHAEGATASIVIEVSPASGQPDPTDPDPADPGQQDPTDPDPTPAPPADEAPDRSATEPEPATEADAAPPAGPELPATGSPHLALLGAAATLLALTGALLAGYRRAAGRA